MTVLAGFRVLQLGPGLAAAVCGRLLADAGACVAFTDRAEPGPLAAYLDAGKPAADASRDVAAAALIVVEGAPAALRRRGHDLPSIRAINPHAPVVFISPYGQSGPDADLPASDLTLAYASGIARLLTGQVDDLEEAPLRPVGAQSAFIAGIAAACAGMHAALHTDPHTAMGASPGAAIDVSMQEALATLAMTELARAGLTGKSWQRKRQSDGNGATVCILPARDGYVAISPREGHQWESWLTVMGSPAWGREPRFRHKADRVAHWDALHSLMSAWSRGYDKQWIADAAQRAHVPSFPLREPGELLASPQLAHRGFYRSVTIGDRAVLAPGAPFGISGLPADGDRDGEGGRPAPHEGLAPGAGDGFGPLAGLSPPNLPLPNLPLPNLPPPGLPLSGLPLAGVRVLDFSWVIAGPTTTRYLAAMGADVIKVEAPGRGDPGRASELHTVLGQAKRAIVLDLKRPDAVAVARALAARCDVVVENFATGVMDRLGLGADALRAVNPALIFVSASGLGRSGPEAHAVAYGTLLQCYAGFAGLNRHPEVPPRVGFAWLDPMCGLMLAFITAAALWRRRRGGGAARIDFSMIEAMLWTMAEPLLAAQLAGPPRPMGNASPLHAPHGAYRCAGEDAWVAVAVTSQAAWEGLCGVVPGLGALAGLGCAERRGHAGIAAALAGWCRERTAPEAAAALAGAGVPAAALASAADLVGNPHLRARGFWDAHGDGVLPGLPWQGTIGRRTGDAPGLGAQTEQVLVEVLGFSLDRVAALRQAGALG